MNGKMIKTNFLALDIAGIGRFLTADQASILPASHYSSHAQIARNLNRFRAIAGEERRRGIRAKFGVFSFN